MAHFHYVLSISAVYGTIMGFCKYQNIFTGSISNNLMYELYFFILFLGVNMVFFPIHQVRLYGMPRRYYVYNDMLQKTNMFIFGRVILLMISWVRFGLTILYANQGRVLSDEVVYGRMPAHT